MVVDTDVLIWYLRGSERARRAIDRLGSFAVSAVTYMELVQGMRSKDELVVLRKSFARTDTRVLPISESVSTRAIIYVEQHFLSHSLTCTDALVAATAVAHGEALLTANVKHYRPISDLTIAAFRP